MSYLENRLSSVEETLEVLTKSLIKTMTHNESARVLREIEDTCIIRDTLKEVLSVARAQNKLF